MTDAIGFALLVPIFRQFLIKKMMLKGQTSMHQRSQYSDRQDSNIIEGEIIDDDDKKTLK